MQTTAPSTLSPWMDGALSYSSPESRMPKVEIKSGPVSLRTLAVLGLIVFAIGFWHGREIRDAQTVVAEPTNHSAESQTAVVSASEDSTRAAAEPNRSSTTIPVTI